MPANLSERTEVTCDCEALTEKKFFSGHIASEQEVVPHKEHFITGDGGETENKRKRHKQTQAGFLHYCIWCSAVNKWKLSTIVLSVLLVISIAVIIYQSAKPPQLSAAPNTPGPMLNTSYTSLCPERWIKNGELCYYFSDAEATWNASRILCSSERGSLVAMDTPQEWEFVSQSKRPRYYWIGLRRTEVGRQWEWVNGSLFNNQFPVGGEGLCAYLNVDEVSSTWCDNHRYWICRKHQHGNT